MRWTAGGLSALMLAGVAALVLSDPAAYRMRIVAAVHEATGRDLSIAGPISLAATFPPGLVLSDVALGNPEWAREADFVRARTLLLVPSITAMLHGKLALERISMADFQVDLQTDASGRSTWDWDLASGAVAGAVPAIELTRGIVRYRDADTDRRVAIERVSAGSGADGTRAQGKLRANGQALSFSLRSETPLWSSAAPARVPLSFTLRFAHASASGEGHVRRNGGALRFSTSLRITAGDASALGTLVDAPLPLEGPFTLTASVVARSGAIGMEIHDAEVAGMKLDGTLAYNHTGERARLVANLHVDRLAIPASGAFGPSTGAIRDTLASLLASRLRMDIDLALGARALHAGSVALGPLELKSTVNAGTLDAVVVLGTNDKTVHADLHVDRSANMPTLSLGVDAVGLDLAPLLIAAGIPVSGAIRPARSSVQVNARGRGPGEWIRSLGGDVAIQSLRLGGAGDDTPLAPIMVDDMVIAGRDGRLTDLSAHGNAREVAWQVRISGDDAQAAGVTLGWPLLASARLGPIAMRAKGTLEDPLGERRLEAEVTAQAEHLDMLAQPPGAGEGLDTPLSFSAHLSKNGTGFALEGINLRLGRTRLSGAVRRAGATGLSSTIDVQMLDPEELAGIAAALSRAAPGKPAQALPEWAGGAVLDLKLGVAHIHDLARIGDFKATARFRDNQLKLDPLHFTLSGTAMRGSIEADLGKSRPPIRIALDSAADAWRAQGTLASPVSIDGLSLDVALKGGDLSWLRALLDVPWPMAGAYAGQARVDWSHGRLALTRLRARIGSSNVTGALALETGSPARLELDLVSDNVLVARARNDLAADGGGTEPGARLIPDLPLAGLLPGQWDTRLRWRVGRLTLDAYEFRDVLVEADTFGPRVDLRVAGRSPATREPFESRYRFDPGRTPPAELVLQSAALDTGWLFPGSGESAAHWPAKVSVTARGTGRGLHDLLAGADGHIAFTAGRARGQGAELERWELGLLALMLPSLGETPKDRIECLVADLGLAGGIATVRGAMLETGHVSVAAGGTVNLGTEALDLMLTPRPKDLTLLNVATPVRVSGTLAAPNVSAAPADIALSTGKLLLGAANPLKIIGALVLPKTRDGNRCEAALAKAR